MKKKSEKSVFIEILSNVTSVEKVNKGYSLATATSANGSYTFGVDMKQSIEEAAKECAKRYNSQITPVRIPNGPTQTAMFLQIVANHRETAGLIRNAIVFWSVTSGVGMIIDYANRHYAGRAGKCYDMLSEQEREDWIKRMTRRAINDNIRKILFDAVKGTQDLKIYYKIDGSFDFADRVAQFPKAWL